MAKKDLLGDTLNNLDRESKKLDFGSESKEKTGKKPVITRLNIEIDAEKLYQLKVKCVKDRVSIRSVIEKAVDDFIGR